jgi:hypothetical protein
MALSIDKIVRALEVVDNLPMSDKPEITLRPGSHEP